MYEGPITYETEMYDTFLILASSAIIAFLIVLFLISLSKIFKKADKNPLLAFVPFYNIIILLQVVYLPSHYLILLLIPIINLYPMIKISIELGKTFRKKKSFVAGLFFLPIIYYPLLAFKEDRYVGMNDEKVDNIVLEDLSEQEEEEKPIIEESGILITTKNESEQQQEQKPRFLNQEMSKGPIEVKMPEFKKTIEPEYKECPKCRNKVKKDASTCFICGHHFERG